MSSNGFKFNNLVKMGMKFGLPLEVVIYLAEFDSRFILRCGQIMNRIPLNDSRFTLFETVPIKEFDEQDGVTYVYITITSTKDYFLAYKNSDGHHTLAIQVFRDLCFNDSNGITLFDANIYEIV